MKLYKVNSQFVQDLFRNRDFLRRINTPVHINFNWDIPYLVGSSKDRKTIYIDRHLKRYMTFKGKKIDITEPLIVYAVVQNILMDMFRMHRIRAHHIAKHFKFLVLAKQNITSWEYGKFTKVQVKTVYSKKLVKVPLDLDLNSSCKNEDEKNTIRQIQNKICINTDVQKQIYQIDPEEFIAPEEVIALEEVIPHSDTIQ